MRAWLQGDLSGVDARAELGLVREVAERAIAEGEDLAPLLTALAELDPVACAELVAGPRALVALQILPLVLELAAVLAPVLPPQALAQRLLSLYPDHRDPVLMWALHANPGSAWPWRLDRSERPLGMAALRLRSDLDPEVAVVEALARGLTDAVVARAASGDLPALRALVQAPDAAPGQRAAAAWLDAGHDGALLAWAAAWWGPDLAPWVDAVADRVQTAAGLDRLAQACADIPELAAVIADRSRATAAED